MTSPFLPGLESLTSLALQSCPQLNFFDAIQVHELPHQHLVRSVSRISRRKGSLTPPWLIPPSSSYGSAVCLPSFLPHGKWASRCVSRLVREEANREKHGNKCSSFPAPSASTGTVGQISGLQLWRQGQP